MVKPEQKADGSQNNQQQACPSFFEGSLVALGRVDKFFEHHDKSILAVFTIVLAISTTLLWWSTDKLWKAGERQLVTTRSVAAVHARNNRRQLKLAEETAEKQLRAYVAVVSFDFGGKDVRDPTELKLTVRNGGQTPAYNLSTHCNRSWFDFGANIPDDFEYRDYAPGDVHTAAVLSSGGSTVFTHRIDPTEIQRVRDKKAALFIYGHADYTDVFGHPRVSRYCYEYFVEYEGGKDVGHRLVMQRQHNDAT